MQIPLYAESTEILIQVNILSGMTTRTTTLDL